MLSGGRVAATELARMFHTRSIQGQSQESSPVHPAYRRDIDGLRAIAVLSVVGFHAFPRWVRSGFVGVDIFFVISGFLISTIIFASVDRGAFSFADFYGRRIRRIFPALIAVMAAGYAFAWFFLFADEFKQLGEEMASYVAAGFQAVKMKVGRLSPAQEEARIKAVREAIGPDVLLMLDANNAWLDLPTAMRYMERYEPYQPYWIEEPFSPDEIDLHARLARSITTTVATGEIGYGRWYHKELLDKGGAEILQTDALVCGGISEWRRIAATAASYGVTMCPHWFHDLHAHLVASTPNARYVEFFIDDQVLNFRRLIDTQLKHKGGYLSLPKTPGLGFDFDEKAVKRYALTPAKPWTVMR